MIRYCDPVMDYSFFSYRGWDTKQGSRSTIGLEFDAVPTVAFSHLIALLFLERDGNPVKQGFSQVVHQGPFTGLYDYLDRHVGLKMAVAQCLDALFRELDPAKVIRQLCYLINESVGGN